MIGEQTDRAFPVTQRYSPADVLATATSFGINPHHEFQIKIATSIPVLSNIMPSPSLSANFSMLFLCPLIYFAATPG
jgi:hypothetical protein